MEIVSIKHFPQYGYWKLTYDGAFLGDDRSYATKELAWDAAIKWVERDRLNALRYDRPVIYQLGPEP